MSQLIFLSTRDGFGTTNYERRWPIESNRFNIALRYKVALIDLEMPNTVYPINEYNNKLSWNDTAGVVTLTIPENAYTGSQMATYLNSNMQPASDAVGATNVITCTYDSQSQKLSFASAANFYFIDVANSPLQELGLLNTGSAYAALSQVSSVPINLSGSQCVQLISSFSTKNFSSSTSAGVLANVPLDTGFGSVIYYQAPLDVDLFVTAHDLAYVSIFLRDDRGNPWKLPLNSHLNLTLKISELQV